jgi:hypothetical protein
MTPEEQLDQLIERWEQGAWLGPVANAEIETRLTAAKTVAALHEIDVPPAFAARLEARLRARARHLAQRNGHEIAVPRPRKRVRSQRVLLGRAWTTAVGIAAVVLLTCISAFTASAQSLPGDPLYGLKQLEQQVTLAFASSPQDHAQLQISQLRSALNDLSAVVSERRQDETIQEALGVVADRTRASQAAVAALPTGPDQAAAERDLVSTLAMEDQTLRGLLARLDWPLRLAFTQQLGALGDAIPTITRVQVSRPTNNQLQITVTGTNFAPDVALMINGVPKGTVSKRTATQLVALITPSDWPRGTRTVGVLNPDGTAAQRVVKGTDGDGDQDDDDGHEATPGATSTPEPGNDGEDDGTEHGGTGGSNGTPTPPPDH